MINILVILCIFPAFIISDSINPIYDLMERISPGLKNNFVLSLNSQKTDYFQLSSNNSHIFIEASNTNSLAVGFNYYLNKFLNSSISWTGDNINIPKQLPKGFPTIKIERNFKYSYYMNACTFSYSMVWWDWKRWEKELDWMALKGINMALAFTGQEKVWLKTFLDFGVSEEDVISKFFVGPAFLAWSRMGEIKGWAGPLSKIWIDDQFELGIKIMRRMEELGITPILPTFNGFVPEKFKELFPNTTISQAAKWNRFNSTYCCVYFMEPQNELYGSIASKFIENFKNMTNSTSHYYNGDQFNELNPKSTDPEYLKNASRAMIDGISKADPQGIWIMQGWLFLNKYWKNNLIEAYLSGVPNDRMIILDLYSELKPVYQKVKSYFGKPFIWNQLHDFGGRMGLFGRMQNVMNNPFQAQKFEPMDLFVWTNQFIVSRYGKNEPNTQLAWKKLVETMYEYKGNLNIFTNSIILYRPSYPFKTISKAYMFYDYCDLVDGWKTFLKAIPSFVVENESPLAIDLLDVTRQVLSDLYALINSKYQEAVGKKDVENTEIISKMMLQIIDDMDELLGTSSLYLLGKWIKDAEAFAHNDTVLEKLFKFNAKNQVTMWGPEANINDYASKQWNGLFKQYYKKRWSIFFEEIQKYLIAKQSIDTSAITKKIFDWEKEWNFMSNDSYISAPQGNTIDVVLKLAEKYKNIIDEECPNKNKSFLGLN